MEVPSRSELRSIALNRSFLCVAEVSHSWCWLIMVIDRLMRIVWVSKTTMSSCGLNYSSRCAAWRRRALTVCVIQIIPAICVAAGFLVLLLYPIDTETFGKITTLLNERKNKVLLPSYCQLRILQMLINDRDRSAQLIMRHLVSRMIKRLTRTNNRLTRIQLKPRTQRSLCLSALQRSPNLRKMTPPSLTTQW